MRNLFLVSPCRAVIVTTVVGAFSMYANAVTIYVDEDASPGGNGILWGSAYQFLQDALEDSITGDEIWVAEGTYYPDDGLDDPPMDLRNASFELIDGVGIYGGFVGNEVERKERDPETNITTLSGDIDHDDGNSPDFDNSLHVVSALNVGSTTILSGFNIIRGRAEFGEIEEDDHGAGILILDASPVITRCTLFKNFGLKGGGIGVMGVTGTAAPTIINCSFLFNVASVGGGMHLEGAAIDSALLVNCLFSYGYAIISGAIYVRGPALDIRNSTLYFSDSEAEGIISIGDGSQVIITNSIIWGISFQPKIFIDPVTGGSATVSYSDVENGWDGIGNIDSDPNLVDPANSDFRLGFGSPCIDVALNDDVEDDSFDVDDDMDTDEKTPDLDLNARIEDGLADSNFDVDMGSFEYRCLGDIAGAPGGGADGMVGIADFLGIIVAWGPNPGHPADLDRDDDVDINDFLGLLANWGDCPLSTAFPLTLQEELDDACITQAEYDDYVDVMTDPTSKASDKIRYDCWMRHWIYYCPDCTCSPAHCPGVDPFK